jgi:hypothetical protein
MIHEAKTIALDHGCFISEKNGAHGQFWVLYRRGGDPDKKPIFIGQRNSPAAIRRLVEDACSSGNGKQGTGDRKTTSPSVPRLPFSL